MKRKLHLMIVAGELSSDNHGAKLIRELKNNVDIRITAVGGDKMGSEADRLEENIVRKAAVGFVEIIKLIPYFASLKKRLTKKYFGTASDDPVDALVLIDFPGFNMRLAKEADLLSVPVFYYITPQVWAWGSGRIKILSDICKRLYCLFEFEKEIFQKEGADVEFVGHPILEDIPGKFDIAKFNEEIGIGSEDFLLALLPGSRESEIKRHLPSMVRAVKNLDRKVVIGKSPALDKGLLEKLAPGMDYTENIYSLMKRADLAVVSSGTATLEIAVLGTPFITIYKVSPLSYIIAKMLVSIEFVSMVNILAGREVVPELIQGDFTPDLLEGKIKEMIDSPDMINNIKAGLNEVADKIGLPGASHRTARSILSQLDAL